MVNNMTEQEIRELAEARVRASAVNPNFKDQAYEMRVIMEMGKITEELEIAPADSGKSLLDNPELSGQVFDDCSKKEQMAIAKAKMEQKEQPSEKIDWLDRVLKDLGFDFENLSQSITQPSKKDYWLKEMLEKFNVENIGQLERIRDLLTMLIRKLRAQQKNNEKAGLGSRYSDALEARQASAMAAKGRGIA